MTFIPQICALININRPIVALVPEQPLSLKSLDQHSRVPVPSLW